MALKKPSELLNDKKESPESFLDKPVQKFIEQPELNSFSEVFDSFKNNLGNIEVLSGKVEEIQAEVKSLLKKEDLERAMVSQLLVLEQSIRDIQGKVKGINESNLESIKGDIATLSTSVNNFIEVEVPKYEKRTVESEFRIGKNFSQLESNVNKSLDVINEFVENKYQELAESLEGINEQSLSGIVEDFKNLENIINDFKTEVSALNDEFLELKEGDIPSYKKFIVETEIKSDKNLKEFGEKLDNTTSSILEKVNLIDRDHTDLVDLITSKVTEVNGLVSTVELSEEKIKEKISNLELEVIRNESHLKTQNKNLEKLQEDIKSSLTGLSDLVEECDKNNYDLGKKIKYLEEVFTKFDEKEILTEGLLNSPSETNSDPLTPTDQNFVTLDQLQNHYRLFINRIQQQLSTLGGGGETRLEFLDDVDRDTAKVNGKFLKYDSSSGKWVGANASGGAGSQTLDETLDLGNTSSTGMSVGVVTATELHVAQLESTSNTLDINDELKVLETLRVTGDNREFIIENGSANHKFTVDTNNGNTQIMGDLQVDGGATFIGNVSIAGTLTYEDVTNIDAIGVVTARSGVTVTSGGLDVTGVSIFQSHVELGDDDELRIGDNKDLRLYHDGFNSYVADNGVGSLILASTFGGVLIRKHNENETMAGFNPDSSVDLYFNGDKKFETTASGIDVTGHTETDTLNVSGISTFQNNVHLLDNDKLLIGGSVGTHDGLEIYHDSNHSYIDDSGTGNLYLRSGTLSIQNLAGSKTSAVFNSGSGQELYHNNSKKFETTASGINVTGHTETDTLRVSGVSTFQSLVKPTSGIDVTGHTETDTLRVSGISTFQSLVKPISGIDVTGHTETDTLRVSGISTFQNNIKLTVDNKKLIFGSGDDLEIFHDGNANYIVANNGSFTIKNPAFNYLKTSSSTGRVQLFHGNSPKFETTGAGVTVFGTTKTQQLDVTGNSTFTGVSTFNDQLKLPDYTKIMLGASNDMQILHIPGNSNTIQGTSPLFLQTTSEIHLREYGGAQIFGKFIRNGAVELYHSGNKKFDTTASGIDVTGHTETDTLNVSGVSTFTSDVSFGSTITFGDNDQIIMGDGPDLKLYHDGSNSYVEDTGTGALIMKGSTVRFRSTTNENMLSASQNGAISLYYNNNVKLETTASGINVTGHTETDTLNVSGISTFGNNVEINGNLSVSGTRTFLNTTELEVQDINIGIASAVSKLSNAQLDGAGITIYGSAGDKTLTWSNANSRMEFNTNLYAPNLTTSGIDVTGHTETDTLNVSGVSTFTSSHHSFAKITRSSNGTALQLVNTSTADGASVDHSFVIDGSTRARIRGNIHGGSLGGNLRFFTTDDTETLVQRAIFDKNGNFGIGINSPTSTLHVIGTVQITDKIMHSGDNDTAIRFPATNRFAVETAGIEALRVDGSQRVGIGSDDLQARFTVYSADNNAYTREIRIDASDAPSGSNGHGVFRILGDGNSLGKYIIGYNSTHPSQANDVSLKNSDGDISFHTASNDTPEEKLRITTGGRIGINQSSPEYTLDLGEANSTIRLVAGHNGTALRVGAGGGSNDVTLIRIDGSSQNDAHNGESDSGQYGFSLKYMGSRSGNANALSIFSDNQIYTQYEAFTVLQDGSIGIGQPNPQVLLHLKKTGDPNVIQENSADDSLDRNNTYSFRYGDGEGAFVKATRPSTGTRTDTYLALGSGGSTERLRLDSSGRLLLGTTTEGAALADNFTVADSGDCGITIRSGTSNYGSIYFSDATSGADEYRGQIEYNHNTDILRVYSGGTAVLRIDPGKLEVIGEIESDSLDVTGHTETDTLNVSGITTLNSLQVDTFSTFNGNTKHFDGKYANFGNDTDLQIVHDGSNSVIQNATGQFFIDNNASGGDLFLRANDNVIIRVDGNDTMLTAQTGGVVIAGDVEIDEKIVHGGDTNTHVSFPSNDYIRLTTSGSSRLNATPNGYILLGTNSEPTGGDAHSRNARLLIQGRIGNTADSGRINLQRGSAASNGSSIGSLTFTDNSNNAYARIETFADAAPGTDDYPGRIVFSTTPDGSASPTEKLRITSDGKFGFGTNNPQGTVHISSGTSGDATLILEADTDNNQEADNPYIVFRQDGGVNASAIGHGVDSGVNGNVLTIANSISDGAITFATGSTNVYTNATERVRIDSTGAVTKATNPCFKSNFSDTYGSAGSLITSPSTAISHGTAEFDRGNNFTTTGSNAYTFVCPVTGIYAVHAHFSLGDITEGNRIIFVLGYTLGGGDLPLSTYVETMDTVDSDYQNYSYYNTFYFTAGTRVGCGMNGVNGTVSGFSLQWGIHLLQ